MKRSNKIERQRQSPFAILVLVARIIQNLVKQFSIIIVVLLLGGNRSEDRGSTALMISFGILVFTIARGVVTYFRYYYSVSDEHLIVEKGLFSTSKISIPLDRIQAVDFDQTVIHKLVNLVKVNITTAGSSGSEASIEAVTLEKANELRDVLLHQRKTQTDVTPSRSLSLDLNYNTNSQQIFSLNPLHLFKVGLAENHIKSGFIILGFIFWIIQQAEDADLLDKLKDQVPDINIIKSSVLIISTLIVLMTIASVVISLVKTIVQYFNLKLVRKEESFQLSYGLINSRQFTAKDQKIQVIGWERTWLQKQFDYYTLYFKQASSRTVTEKKRLSIPGCSEQHVKSVRSQLGYSSHSDSPWSIVSPTYKFYSIRNLFIFGVLLFSAILLLGDKNLLLMPLSLYLIYRIISVFKTYNKITYRITEGLIQIAGGTFGNSLEVLQSYKIQAVRLRSGLFQRRRDLTDLYLFTASGSLLIPFLPLDTAKQIRDQLLYTVESSTKDWM